MLNWIKGEGSDHPLADAKRVRELLSELPSDPFKALEELRGWLQSVDGVQELSLARKLAVVDAVDRTARPPLERLTSEFLASGGKLQRVQEARISAAVGNHFRQLAAAYLLLLERHRASSSGWGGIRDNMPLVIARALRATGARLKWQLLRYAPVERDIWQILGRLWHYAEGHSIEDARLSVYPGSDSTLRREFLKPIMLAISSADSLHATKLELAEKLIAHFTSLCLVQRQPGKGCHFLFDLDAGRAPVRLVARIQMTQGIRFFGPGNSVQAINGLIAAVQIDGAVPAVIDLGGPQDPQTVVEVSRHLVRYWSPQAPERSGARRQSLSQIDVVHGFEEVVAKLEGNDQAVEFGAAAETWNVENESDGGFGAVLPQSKGGWLRIGMLLGVKLSDEPAWGVGVVRRLSGRDDGQRYVGIQILAKGATGVRVRPASSGGEMQTGVLLPSSVSDSVGRGELDLLLREGTFSPQESLEMLVYDRTYLLMPRRLIEEGSDFDVARFGVQQYAG